MTLRYISADEHWALVSKVAEIGRMLNGMMKNLAHSLLTSEEVGIVVHGSVGSADF